MDEHVRWASNLLFCLAAINGDSIAAADAFASFRAWFEEYRVGREMISAGKSEDYVVLPSADDDHLLQDVFNAVAAENSAAAVRFLLAFLPELVKLSSVEEQTSLRNKWRQLVYAPEIIRLEVARTFSRLDSAAARAELITVFQSEAERFDICRMTVIDAMAMGSLDSRKDNIPLLARILTTDENFYGRLAAANALGDIGGAQALPALLEGFRDHDELVRVACLRGVAQLVGELGGGATVGADLAPIHAALSDSSWRVKIVAAGALRTYRSSSSVAPLIAALRREQNRPAAHGDVDSRLRNRVAIRDALASLTGKRFDEDRPELYERWWAEARDHFRPVAQLRTGPVDPRPKYPTFFDVALDTDRVLFLIDVSGSMLRTLEGGALPLSGGRFSPQSRYARLLHEMDTALRQLKPSTRFRVLAFNLEVSTYRQQAVPCTEASARGALAFLANQRPHSGTNIHDALAEAMGLATWDDIARVRTRSDSIDTIVLVSDGFANCGPVVDPQQILRIFGRLNRLVQVRVHTVSVSGESSLLKGLAEMSGGSYFCLGSRK